MVDLGFNKNNNENIFNKVEYFRKINTKNNYNNDIRNVKSIYPQTFKLKRKINFNSPKSDSMHLENNKKKINNNNNRERPKTPIGTNKNRIKSDKEKEKPKLQLNPEIKTILFKNNNHRNAVSFDRKNKSPKKNLITFNDLIYNIIS